MTQIIEVLAATTHSETPAIRTGFKDTNDGSENVRFVRVPGVSESSVTTSAGLSIVLLQLRMYTPKALLRPALAGPADGTMPAQL